MGADELQPLSRRGKSSFGGLGATIVDSLDTLWMLGLKEEFGRARDWVAHELSFDKCGLPHSTAGGRSGRAPAMALCPWGPCLAAPARWEVLLPRSFLHCAEHGF